jgi:hypothetical protein
MIMARRRHLATGGKAAWTGAWLLFCLAACEPLWSAPESRAQDFIETLVTAPTETQKLRDLAGIAPDRNPDDLLSGLSARVALDFLRAKQAQGASLKFTRGEVQRIDDTRRGVTILVTYLESGVSPNDEVRMQVQMEKDEQGHWRIARVAGGN